MNYLQMLDELDDVLSSSRKIPLSSYVIMSESQLCEIINDLRQHFPEEIKQSSLIISQRNEIIAKAKSEAHEIIDNASREKERMSSQHEVYRMAQEKVERLRKDVKSELINLLRNMNEVLLALTKNYSQQCQKMEEKMEASYGEILDKFQEIKENLIDKI
jgi:adenylosuccinate synthase